MNAPLPAGPNTDDTARPDFRGGRSRALGLLAQAQGVFYFLSGAWPLVHPDSFQLVTGPKLELWLVQTVGVLLIVSGAVLFLAGRARRVTREIVFLGAGQAGALAGVDLWCVLEPRTTRAYWLDALAELALVAAWLILATRRK